MKLIIAGSRSISDYELLKHLIVHSGFWKHKAELEIVCGMALHWKWKEDPLIGGVDRLGWRLAKKNGLPLHEHPADWKTHGPRAGYVRNALMASVSDALLALWDGNRSGTDDMIQHATRRGLLVKAYKCIELQSSEDGGWAYEEVV